MENEEIKEIIETQKVIEGVIVANSDAIKQIDLKLKEIFDSKPQREATTDTSENTVTIDEDHVTNKLRRREGLVSLPGNLLRLTSVW